MLPNANNTKVLSYKDNLESCRAMLFSACLSLSNVLNQVFLTWSP